MLVVLLPYITRTFYDHLNSMFLMETPPLMKFSINVTQKKKKTLKILSDLALGTIQTLFLTICLFSRLQNTDLLPISHQSQTSLEKNLKKSGYMYMYN